ncbi:acyltransferase family protein [Polynucleobacter necessarius]|uniref:acyltransferase family protein n=1 Tax=Polynucleobacter necessarius TaxID=576610 RepID=UPI002F92B46B
MGQVYFWGAFFIDNFVALGDAGYFDKNTELKPLVHLWSLGIEEQFYLFWPLIILLSNNSLRIKISILLLILIALSFGFNLREISQNPMDAFYTPWARMWELLLGGLLAYTFLQKSKGNLTQSNNLFSSYSLASKSINNLCSCIGAVLLLYGVFFSTEILFFLA